MPASAPTAYRTVGAANHSRSTPSAPRSPASCRSRIASAMTRSVMRLLPSANAIIIALSQITLIDARNPWDACQIAAAHAA